jgi:YidC/Oxa1 family membrane protein insertase
VNIFDLIVIQPIFNLLIGLYSLIPGGDFGIAVIIFTILVRLALWPLVKKQFHQVKAMQKMQPELVKIKKATKGNKQLESMQMMELYKKHDINPFRSIGILLIQLPIFIALYRVIQIFTLHRSEVDKFTYGFMKGIGPVKELIAHPNSLNEKLFGIIDLTKQAISSNPLSVNIFLLVLAIIAAITQYIMSKQTSPTQQSNKSLKEIMSEATDGKQTDQSEMNAVMMGKMVKFMPIMMFFIMIYLPGALVLYYTVSNLAAVLQQHSILNKDTEEMIDIADKADISQNKKATAKARLKQAQTAQITRIVAKDTVGNKKEKL